MLSFLYTLVPKHFGLEASERKRPRESTDRLSLSLCLSLSLRARRMLACNTCKRGMQQHGYLPLAYSALTTPTLVLKNLHIYVGSAVLGGRARNADSARGCCLWGQVEQPEQPTPLLNQSADVLALQARIGALEELQAETRCKLESKSAEIAALRARLSEQAAQRGAAEGVRGEPVRCGDESAFCPAPATLDAAAVHHRSLLRSWIAQNYEDFFDQTDDNKSNDLCFDEFERICQSYADKVDLEVVRSLFDEMAQGNEKISRACFFDVAAQLRAVRNFVSLSSVELLVDGLASMMFARPSQQGDPREFLAHITDARALVATLPAALCRQAEVFEDKGQLTAHAKATADCSKDTVSLGQQARHEHDGKSVLASANKITHFQDALQDAQRPADAAQAEPKTLGGKGPVSSTMHGGDGHSGRSVKAKRTVCNLSSPEFLEAEDALLSFWIMRGGGESGDEAFAPWFFQEGDQPAGEEVKPAGEEVVIQSLNPERLSRVMRDRLGVHLDSDCAIALLAHMVVQSGTTSRELSYEALKGWLRRRFPAYQVRQMLKCLAPQLIFSLATQVLGTTQHQDGLDRLRSLTQDDVHRAIQASAIEWVDAIWAKITHFQSAVSEGQDDGGNLKFAGDFSGNTYEGKFGSSDTFDDGLDKIIGLPDPKVLQAIINEHCNSANSTVPFMTSNYNLICTPEEELEAALKPDLLKTYPGAGDGHGMREIVPFQIFLSATGCLHREDDETKDVLCQIEDICGSLKLSEQDLVREAQVLLMIAVQGFFKTIEQVQRLLKEQDTPGRPVSMEMFCAAVEKVKGWKQGTTEKFIERGRDLYRLANLRPEEVLGIRLYTGKDMSAHTFAWSSSEYTLTRDLTRNDSRRTHVYALQCGAAGISCERCGDNEGQQVCHNCTLHQLGHTEAVEHKPAESAYPFPRLEQDAGMPFETVGWGAKDSAWEKPSTDTRCMWHEPHIARARKTLGIMCMCACVL